MHVCLGLLAGTFNVEERYPNQVYPPKTGGSYLLPGHKCLPETDHND